MTQMGQDETEHSKAELDALRERYQQMARLLTGDPDAQAECSYCHQQVDLGEALMTAHISGVLAHLQCPQDALEQILKTAGPSSEFDFDGFATAVDRRVKSVPAPSATSGEIVMNDAA
ncbi:MAG: hypothetical protein J7M25_18000 [Deltaproteobacteria bacterium]|nr:hypothetical protein [Deltaproteobacteria bacterium]